MGLLLPVPAAALVHLELGQLGRFQLLPCDRVGLELLDVGQDVDQVEDVAVFIAVGVLVGLEGEGAVVERHPTEVLGIWIVGVEPAGVGALPAPFVGPFRRGDVPVCMCNKENTSSAIVRLISCKH